MAAQLGAHFGELHTGYVIGLQANKLGDKGRASPNL